MVLVCRTCNDVLPDFALFCCTCGTGGVNASTPCPGCQYPQHQKSHIHCSNCGFSYQSSQDYTHEPIVCESIPEEDTSRKKEEPSEDDPKHYSMDVYATKYLDFEVQPGKKQRYDRTVLISWEPAKAREKSSSYQRLREDLWHEAGKIWRWVTAYMGDRKSSKDRHVLLLEFSRFAYTRRPELRDEIYCVCIKQLTKNPSNESREYGWQLMNELLLRFGPGDRLRPFFNFFIRKESKESSHNDIIQRHIASITHSLTIHQENPNTIMQYCDKSYSLYNNSSGDVIPKPQLLFYTKEITQPLHNLGTDMNKEALKEMKHINRYMIATTEAPKKRAYDKMLVILQRNNMDGSLMDEVLCQLVKQTTFPPNDKMQTLGFELFSKLIGRVKPSIVLYPYLLSHFIILMRNPEVAESSLPFVKTIHQRIISLKEYLEEG